MDRKKKRDLFHLLEGYQFGDSSC